MPVNRLASTLFQNNSSDAMLVKDAYNVSSTTTNNSLFDSVKGIYADSVKGLQSNKGSITQLASLIQAGKAGTIDKTEMLTRALGAMGSSLPSLLGTIGGTLKNKLTSLAGSQISDDATKAVTILYGGASALVKVSSVKDADGLASFLQELSGNSDLMKVVNIEAQSAIFSGILSQVQAYNLPDLSDSVVGQIDNKQVKQNALAYISTSAVNGSDLVTINKVIDQIGLTTFLANNPNAINSILNSFFFGTTDTVDTYTAKRAELITTLVRIDAHWDQALVNGVYVSKLEPFTTASADAKTLFKLADPERTLSLVAPSWTVKDTVSVCKDLYPNALIGTS